MEAGSAGILCCGEVTLDEICAADGVDGDSVSVKLRSRGLFYGGRGANFSVFAGLFGIKTSLLGAVGTDQESRAYVDYLRGLGIETSGLFEIPGGYGSKCFIFNEGERTRIFFYGGALLERREEYIAHVSRKVATMEHALIYCTSPEQEINAACLLSSGAQTKCYAPSSNIYTHSTESVTRCLESTDILFLNERESRFIENSLGMGLEEVAGKFKIKVIVKTVGERGCIIIEGGKEFSVPSCRPERVVETTGAGDAFAGAFAANYIRTGDAVRSAGVAAAAASFVVEKVGCQTNVPDVDRVMRRASGLL